ncbi:MAG: putative glycoside hydrolase [Holosporaceae bacterium]|jgi:hypothetical protein|nr:putative glycoside hydrolase [Holosporaceae bacterium]
MYRKILYLLLIALTFTSCEYRKDPLIRKQAKKNIKSIYIGRIGNVPNTIKLVKSLDANAVVIDVKDDLGVVPCDMDVPTVKKSTQCMSDISQKIKELKKNGIYAIARIVAFKDFVRTDLCIRSNDGSIYVDKEKTQWLNPYNPEVWKYLIKISEESVKIGFDEIQFDYIRFSAYLKDDINYRGTDTRSRRDIILQFLKLACNVINKMGAAVSVDVFGCIVDGATNTSVLKSSSNLGQDYTELATIVDYICPMIYPSHFPEGSMGIDHPDLYPYEIVHRFVALSDKMLKSIPNKKAIVRPYLQAFTAKWLKIHQKYGKRQVEEQIKAVTDAGLSHYGLFDFSSRYSFSH